MDYLMHIDPDKAKKTLWNDPTGENRYHTYNHDWSDAALENSSRNYLENRYAKKHKYIDKVRIKSGKNAGKWRYIYEVPHGKGTRRVSYTDPHRIEDAQWGNLKNLHKERRQDAGRDLMTQVNSISKNLPKGRLNNVKNSIKRIAAMAPKLGDLAVQQGAEYIDDGLTFINNTIHNLRNMF